MLNSSFATFYGEIIDQENTTDSSKIAIYGLV